MRTRTLRVTRALVAAALVAASGSCSRGNEGDPIGGSSPSAGASPSADRSQAPSAFRGFAECEPFEPEVLPSGAKPGESRPHPDDKPVDFMRAWGAGRDKVAVGWGREMLDATGEEADDFAPQDWAPQQVVVKDGVRRVVIPIGDQGVGQIAVRFVMDDCPYSLWLPSGLDKEGRPWGYTLAEALEYAQRF